MFALIGAAAAVMYRAIHPLPAVQPSTKRKVSSWKPEEEDKEVAVTIMRLLDGNEIYREPETKVADLEKRRMSQNTR
jgi:hypothetical protein